MDGKEIRVVGYVSVGLTDDGRILMDHDSIPDINVRIELLTMALDFEKKEKEQILKTNPNGNLYS